MLKKGIFLGLIILTIVLTSGCTSGASLPTLREEASILDDVVAKYDNAMGLYRQGDYAGAKAEYVEAVSVFKDCQSKFGEIAKSNLTALEKRPQTSSRTVPCSSPMRQRTCATHVLRR
jgi:hypothetical protein